MRKEKKLEMTETEARILGLLREKHADKEWAFFEQLRNGTGFVKDPRTFDAFAINCLPSKNFLRIAYEIKVDRKDFLREVNSPWKRASAMEHSNQYYFVAPKGIIGPKEVPENTGLIEVNAGGLRTKVVAKHREVKPPDLQFICSLLRAASGVQRHFKIFKYAGREMTEAELMELVNESRDRSEKWELEKARRKAERAWKEGQPEHRLAAAVAKEMGIYGTPTPEEFVEWVAQQKNGVPLARLKSLLYGSRQFCKDLQDLMVRLEHEDQRKDALTHHDEPQRVHGDEGRQDPDPQGD